MKVLILRFSAMGDVLLTTPVFRNWKRCRPDDELHVATKAAYGDVLRFSPYVDRLHLLGEGGSRFGEAGAAGQALPHAGAAAGKIESLEAFSKGGLTAEPKALKDLIRCWRNEGFDAVLDLHQNWRTARVRMAMPRTQWHQMDKRNWDKWRLVQRKRASHAVPHIVERYLEAAAPFGISDDARGLDANLPKELCASALKALPPAFASGYHALVLGAKQFTKRLPAERWQALLHQLETPVVLLGGPEEATLGGQLEALAPHRVFNGAGRSGLLASAALLSGAGRVLSGDTGMMHWAAALGKPICSLWGSTHPGFGMFPYLGGPDALQAYRLSGGAMAIVPGLDCQPCGKIGKSACPKGHFRCMQALEVLDLAAWLEEGTIGGMVHAPALHLPS